MEAATPARPARRGALPRAAARAAGWRLVLDKPPRLRWARRFANIVRDPHAAVLGVLYEITGPTGSTWS